MLGQGLLPGVHDISFGPDGRVAAAVTLAGTVAIYASISELNAPPRVAVSAPRTEGALLHSNGDLYAMAGGVGTLVRYRGSEVIAATDGLFGAHDVRPKPSMVQSGLQTTTSSDWCGIRPSWIFCRLSTT